MASQQLDLLRRRVRYLDGMVGEMQRAVALISREETAEVRRSGARPSGTVTAAETLARRGLLAVSWSPLVHAAAYAAGQLATGQGRWDNFDRRWAQYGAPRVQRMMNGLRDLDRLADETGGVAARRADINSYPEAERTEARQLWDRATLLAREAARLHNNWMASPMSPFDTINRSWGSRMFERYVVRGDPIITLVSAATGTTTSGLVTAAGQGAERAAHAAAPASAAETLARPAPDAAGGGDGNGNGGGNGGGSVLGGLWPGLVTAALVVAGGYLVVQIVKESFSKPSPEEEEE
jgi:chorismate-pyruvate lyase